MGRDNTRDIYGYLEVCSFISTLLGTRGNFQAFAAGGSGMAAVGEGGLPLARVADRIPSVAQALWRATQKRCASHRASGAPPQCACCGSLADLQTLLEGSVILKDYGDAEFVPVGTAALPVAEFAAGSILIRVSRDVEGASARYITQLETLATTSTSSWIWPAVLASRAGDGTMAASCRARAMMSTR